MGWDWIMNISWRVSQSNKSHLRISDGPSLAFGWMKRYGLVVDNNQSPVWLNPYFQAWLGLTPDNGSRAFFGRTSNVLPPLKCSPGIIGFARVPHKTIGIILYLAKWYWAKFRNNCITNTTSSRPFGAVISRMYLWDIIRSRCVSDGIQNWLNSDESA